MDTEMKTIEKKRTQDLTTLPPNAKKKIGVFKTKFNERGEVEKYRAKLVERGYSQKRGTMLKSLHQQKDRIPLGKSFPQQLVKCWCVYQLDVKSALYGEVNETIYVEQPQEYLKNLCYLMVFKETIKGQLSLLSVICFMCMACSSKFDLEEFLED